MAKSDPHPSSKLRRYRYIDAKRPFCLMVGGPQGSLISRPSRDGPTGVRNALSHPQDKGILCPLAKRGIIPALSFLFPPSFCPPLPSPMLPFPSFKALICVFWGLLLATTAKAALLPKSTKSGLKATTSRRELGTNAQRLRNGLPLLRPRKLYHPSRTEGT